MFYSLRSRLMAAFSILLLIPFTALVYLLSNESTRIIQRSIEVSTSQTIEQYASHAATLLTQIEDAGNQALGNSVTQDWLTTHRNDDSTDAERFYGKRRLRELFSSFAINNSNGITITAYMDGEGGIWSQDRSYLTAQWYRQFRLEGQKWTNAHQDPDQLEVNLREQEVNGYVLPLTHLQTLNSEGILKVNYPTELLRNPLDKIRFGESGRAFLLDADGKSVLRQNLSAEASVVSAGLDKVRAQSSEEGDGVLSVRNDGVDYLVFYRTLPEQNWIIIGVVPENELFVTIRHIRNTMLIVSGVLLILVTVAAFWFSKGITNPLSRMALAMKQVQRGDFGKAIRLMPAVKQGHSEVGYVIGAFEQMTYRLKEMIETKFENNMRRKNAEYKALLLQINPHFYNNTLEIISGLAAMKREDLVMDATEAMGKMMRYALNLGSDIVTVAEELDYIRDYLFILKLRYDDRLTVAVQLEPEAAGLRIAKFIVQPLVENAVKYSLEKDGAAFVSIGARVADDRLLLRIADDGIGMPQALIDDIKNDIAFKDVAGILHSKGDSIGLRNVLSRCRIHYGDAFAVDIASELGKGTSITMSLPIVRR